jgi:protein ImuB
MRRVVSVWLPTLPTDRIRRHDRTADATPKLNAAPDRPLVTVAQDGNTRLLAAVDTRAAESGLRVGMKLTEARILVGALIERPADPVGDAAELRRLAEWCLCYAPLAAPDPPDGLWIDVTGSTHLHGGEQRMLQDIVRKLSAQGFAVRAAMADTPGLAHAMARFGGKPVSVAPIGGLPPDQAPSGGLPDDFPIEALRLPAGISLSLCRMGVLHIGQIATIARGPMARRFGSIVALRLDQAAGRVFESIRPIVPEAAIQAGLRFVEPLLTAEAFAGVIDRLTVDVCEALSRRGQGARRLDLRFERVDGAIQAIRTGTARAVRDPAHLRRLLTDRLEKIDPGLGVEAMQLIVVTADRLRPEQAATSLFEASAADPAPLLDRLAGRLGTARVYRMAPIASHVPERSVRRVPANIAVTGSWANAAPRPVRLLDPPQPVDAVAAPDEAPVAFVWRRIRHRVHNADGPERIAGEWWQDASAITPMRDYFRVEDERGRRFWLFRAAGGGQWFLHGFF